MSANEISHSKQAGFFKIILLIIVALVLLQVAGFDVGKILHLPIISQILSALLQVGLLIWKILAAIIVPVWTVILYVLKIVLAALQSLKK